MLAPTIEVTLQFHLLARIEAVALLIDINCFLLYLLKPLRVATVLLLTSLLLLATSFPPLLRASRMFLFSLLIVFLRVFMRLVLNVLWLDLVHSLLASSLGSTTLFGNVVVWREVLVFTHLIAGGLGLVVREVI